MTLFARSILTALLLIGLLTASVNGSVASAAGSVYSEGDEGMTVATLQLKLKKMGFYHEAITGKFDKNTTAAVKEFQEKQQLAADGKVDSVTYEKITKMASPAGSGNSAAKQGDSRNFGARTVAPVIQTAKQYMGTPYRFGGAAPGGFDCSGYTMYVFNKHNIKLPRTADIQYKMGKPVSRANLLPGDLVFFTTYEPGASHVGIYTDNGNFIHASSSKGVTISGLNDSYWRTRYLGARRVI